MTELSFFAAETMSTIPSSGVVDQHGPGLGGTQLRGTWSDPDAIVSKPQPVRSEGMVASAASAPNGMAKQLHALIATGQRFGAIHADPPWQFGTYSPKGEGRSARAHYDTMTIEEICALPVGRLAAKDCVLFLWAIDPMLPEALDVIKAWGFEYKTVGYYWVKLNKAADPATAMMGDCFTGLGYWTRSNPEVCLLATRGKPHRLAKDVRKLIVSPRREHSRKPDEVYDRIERLVGGPCLDLFSRTSRVGWQSCGNQVGLFDAGPVETRRLSSDLRHDPSPVADPISVRLLTQEIV